MAEILALVGLRGSGKSTLGRLLADRLGYGFVDLDQRLAEMAPQHGASAGEILSKLGEPAFRDLESRALDSCLEAPGPQVLATGGGVVEREPNRRRLKAECRSIWLRADLEILCQRVASGANTRPALTGLEPREEMRLIGERRAPLYAEVAEFEVETDGRRPSACADEIFLKLQR